MHNDRDLQREVLDAFQGSIQPVRTPVSYRLGILLVAIVMVILPLLYLGIIALVGFAVYYHAVHDTAILRMAGGRGTVLAVLIYLAPMIIGGILVLTIGMPLVAGLNLRQFAGVLAHEFGHFSQGAGMRLTYVIRTISHWFTRVVYERDEWDEQLVEWSEESDYRIRWILYLARMFVWLTRKILWVLMMVGHGVSGYMLRQMEFDQSIFGQRLDHNLLFPVDQLLGRQEQEQQAFRALCRFLQGTSRYDRPLRLPTWEMDGPTDIEAIVRQVKESREQVVQEAAQYVQHYADYARLDGGETSGLDADLVKYEVVVGQRIAGALRLLHAADFADQIDHAPQWRQDVATLLPVLRRLNDQVAQIGRLGFEGQQLATLFQRLSQDRGNRSVIDVIRIQMRKNFQLISDIHAQLSGLAYPFDHAKGKITLGEFALSRLPDGHNAGAIHEAAAALIESTSRLRARLIGQLCLIAEQVELVLGLEPVPAPPMNP